MNERILPSPVLQTFFVSRETSNCPLISEMIKLGQRLEEIGLADKETSIVSLDYGKRLLINAKNIDLKKMTQHDVVEIVDYDPLKNIMMVIGPKDPDTETPIHWIVQKARRDINALVQIYNPDLVKKFQKTLPMTEKTTSSTFLERAKEILKTLQKGKTILIYNEGILSAGINMNEAQENLRTYLGDQK